jgi:hypothetical protein
MEEEAETKKARLITWRYAPGYRDMDLLCEVEGKQVWLCFGKGDTSTLRNILEEMLRVAGKNPIDK